MTSSRQLKTIAIHTMINVVIVEKRLRLITSIVRGKGKFITGITEFGNLVRMLQPSPTGIISHNYDLLVNMHTSPLCN